LENFNIFKTIFSRKGPLFTVTEGSEAIPVLEGGISEKIN